MTCGASTAVKPIVPCSAWAVPLRRAESATASATAANKAARSGKCLNGAPGETPALRATSRTVTASAPSSGGYYLGAAADPYGSRPELIEDNNTKAGTFISVTP